MSHGVGGPDLSTRRTSPLTNHIWPNVTAAIAHSSHKARAPLTWDPTGHLLSRFAFGPTSAQRSYVAKHGVAAWYSAQVAYGHKYPNYRAHRSVAAVGPLLSKSPYDVRVWLKNHGDEYGWDAM